MISVVTVVNILMLLYFHILNATTSLWTLEKVHHSEVEVFTTRPPVYEDNQSDSRKGTGSKSRWRSGVCPPGEFDPLTVPLLVHKDSNNSSSNNHSSNSDTNEDENKEVTLALKVNQENKIRCVIIDVITDPPRPTLHH